ncbi:glycosyltransferase family 4 protein [Mycobacterium parmense]|uniref:Glycosyl transferase family 1 n=1 Tax=Mycobacterium parmense TaxID=185642 RepID=A0A7I7YT90_9MYCO|nr:glycosyltransferase family 4 protein [Mycobacterium parmense]MCV7349415.1 glycosyltransferase family 4 protein [Mycobacterium parmense]ORW51167.1 glycosyl transferase family 1 [Mycobacterium parmense]BBZ43961.1 glycosyl transferase family 1 [Mycobacterium parmense]
MRIALLSYRSKTHCGGQGVYVRHLSHGLVELGHDVEVFSGQPYPDLLDPRVRLTEVPSLDLYREPDPFRVPRPSEIRNSIDLLELLTTWTAGFPEPRTFTMRAARLLAGRIADFDVVHDNQSLGTGLLTIAEAGLPVVATVHHPITRDRVLDLAAARWWRKPLVHRWYGFLDMQQEVARHIPDLLTVSSSSAADIVADFGVTPDQLHVVPLGVNTELFKPASRPREPGRVIAIASADTPLKGVRTLLHAIARLRTRHDLELRLVAKVEPNGPTHKLIAELGISDIVHVTSGLSDAELAALLASAEVACIPSLYEGFSLPAVEAMASGTPIVASRVGALPEVLGTDGACAELVPPADVDALTGALGELLDSPEKRRSLGRAGRARAVDVFSWEAVAAQTVRVYQRAIARAAAQGGSRC